MQISSDLISSSWAAFTLPVVIMLACAELGFRLGLRARVARGEPDKGTVGAVQGAILGLLGLLLGFTFALATSRYETRRDLVLKEANAIGTTYLRASLLPEAHVAPVRDLLRQYVALRLESYARIYERDVFRDTMARSSELQARLWQHAEAASREAPTAITATFVNALNETIDTEAERITVGRARIPVGVWLLLIIVASLGCLTSSYVSGEEGSRSAFSSAVLPVLIAVVLVLIFDIANPHHGFIGISQQPLVDLQQSIAPPPAR